MSFEMRTSLLLSTFLLLWPAISAQRFDNVALSEGHTVYALAADERGVVWMGTEQGLQNFDGYRATPHFTYGQTGNGHVRALLVRNDTVYGGTEYGLLRYDRRTAQYAPFGPHEPADIRALLPRGDSIIIGAQSGVYAYVPKQGRYAKLAADIEGVYALCEQRGRLFAGTLGGLFEITSRGARKVSLPTGGDVLVNALLPNGNALWAGCEGNLFCLRDGTTLTVDALRGHSVKSLLQTRDGLLAGTDDGLFRISGSCVERFQHDTRRATSLAGNIVWALFADAKQNVWIGTDDGLSASYAHRFSEHFSLDQITALGDGNAISAILEDSRGSLWLGGTDGLLFFPQNIRSLPETEYTWFKQNRPNSLAHNHVRKIVEDDAGDVLICTDHGISFSRGGRGTLQNVLVSDASGRHSATWVYDIAEDAQGRFWIATYGSGIFVVEREKLLAGGQVAAAHHFLDELRAPNVLSLAKDGRGRIWAALAGSGTDRIDPQTMRAEHASDMSVAHLAADNAGNIWMGGYGELTFCDVRTDKLTYQALPEKEGGSVLAIAPVEKDVWVFLPNECLVMRDGKTLRRVALSLPEVYTAHYSKKENAVLVGGRDGITRLRNAAANSKPRSLILSSLQVNDKRYNGAETDCRYLETLTLRHNENHIRLLLSDIPFDGAPTSVYRYRLHGIDQDWQRFDEGRPEINYNGLPPGTYRLEVAAFDQADQPASTAYELRIRILPPWYLSWWAKTIYWLLFFLAIAGLLRYLYVRRRLKEERLARQHSLEQSQLRMNFFSTLASDIRGPLARIIGLVSDVLKDEKNDNLNLIKDESLQLSQRIDEALNFEVKPTVVVNLSESAAPKEDESADMKFLQTATRAIEDNMEDSDFNVSRLQECLGMGSKLIYRKLKQLTGMTPVEYIRHIRMQKAALLLQQGRFSISEVMYMVGFSNSGYFAKCFQQVWGKTPKEYLASFKD